MITRRTLGTLFMGVFLFGVTAGAAQAQTEPEAPVKPSAVTHDTAGKEACMVCHAIGASPILDVPETHEARGNESCMWCHAVDSPMLTATPTNTPHARATSESECARCHGPESEHPEATRFSATHEGRGDESCMWCHEKAEGRPGGR